MYAQAVAAAAKRVAGPRGMRSRAAVTKKRRCLRWTIVEKNKLEFHHTARAISNAGVYVNVL
jgi:hypothetical protein